MNQILSTNKDYNNDYNKSETKKIITIFCIAVIIIACLIIVVAMMSKNKDTGDYATPEIEILRQEDRVVMIRATCIDGIKSISFTWNEENETRVNLDGTPTFERIIDMPENSNNILAVEVISVKGVNAVKQDEFQLDIDTNKPTIDEMTLIGSTLHIEASDDTGIKYLAYQWEDEEEKTIPANEEDNTKLEADINLKRGTYKLTIRVYDISGNKEELSKLIKGVNQPEINVIKYGNVVEITVTHDMGFKQIEYLVNDVLYIYNENYSKYDKDQTMIQFEFPLKNGENIIYVTAYSMEKTSDEEGEEDKLENYANKNFAGKCTYEIGE